MGRQRSFEIISSAEIVTIGELVRLTNTRYSTLKYYTEEGLLTFVQSEENLTRRYNRVQNIEYIEKIKMLKSDGKTITQIKKIILDVQTRTEI